MGIFHLFTATSAIGIKTPIFSFITHLNLHTSSIVHYLYPSNFTSFVTFSNPLYFILLTTECNCATVSHNSMNKLYWPLITSTI